MQNRVHGGLLDYWFRCRGRAKMSLKFEGRRDCYWLYIVTDCSFEPKLQDPVLPAVDRTLGSFRIADLRQACPGVSYPTLQRALGDMRKAGRLKCLGRGPDAEWQKVRG